MKFEYRNSNDEWKKPGTQNPGTPEPRNPGTPEPETLYPKIVECRSTSLLRQLCGSMLNRAIGQGFLKFRNDAGKNSRITLEEL